MSDIKLIKLLSGEDLLAEVVAPSHNGFLGKVIVKNPVRVVVMPNKLDPKTPNIGFAPWMEFSDDKEIKINESIVVCVVNPIKEFLTQYQSMFGKLVTPTTSGILLPGA
jgi:hypothetical protein